MRYLILIIMFIATLAPFNARAFYVDGINYVINEDSSCSVTEGLYDGDIIIPPSILYNGIVYQVNSIADYAFYGCSEVASVRLPETILNIGDNAFAECISLELITIPNTTNHIGEQAFSGCINLESISLPNSLTSISEKTFHGCSKITSISIPNRVDTIGEAAFADCTNLLSIELPSSLMCIGKEAFFGCCKLTSVSFPNLVNRIGEKAFSGCTGIKYVNISNLEGWCKIDFMSDDANPLFYAHSLFLNGEMITNLDIPRDITCINKFVFISSNITSVNIPSSVIEIKKSSFQRCLQLESIFIEDCDSPLSLESQVFSECPFQVLYIGRDLIYDSSSPEYSPFAYATMLNSVTFGSKVTSIGIYAFKECTKLASVHIPDSVITIGEQAFSKCISLTSINIPNSINQIGSWAFENCKSLTSAKISESIDKISDGVFYGCSSLNMLKIPTSVVEIYPSAFEACSSLNTVIIPNSVKYIGAQAFFECVKMKSLTISNSVTDIGDNAFELCNQITAITYIAEKPINCNTSIFSDLTYQSATLNYLKTSWQDFAEVSPWRYFANRKGRDIGFEDEDSIENIKYLERDATAVYDMRGVRVGDSLEGLPHGVYIIRQGSKTTKHAI